MFRGCGTAIITPMGKNGKIDEEGYRTLIERQDAAGVDFIVPSGSTGESATLTHDEHKHMIDLTMEYTKRAKVLAGTGSNSTAEAISLTRYARDAGVHGALLISPYYIKPTQQGIIDHYTTIANACDLPLVIYNVPGRTASNISASTTLELSKVGNIVGIKEASGDLPQIMDIIRQRDDDFLVLSGDDILTYPMMSLGAQGVISVASNIMPKEVSDMSHLMLDGKYEEARGIHYRLMPLFRDLFIDTNPIPVKTAIGMMGLPAGPLRLPLLGVGPEKEGILRATLEQMNVLGRGV